MISKNSKYSVHEDKLTVGNNILIFDFPIKECVEFENMLIVRLDVLGKVKYNENVFGVSLLERKIKWQIEKRNYPGGGREQRCPFVDITVYDNKVRLNNWCDTYFIIDPLTGKILEEGDAR
jgi:hypothetical protein